MKLEEMLNYPCGTMFYRKSWGEYENVFMFAPFGFEDSVLMQFEIGFDKIAKTDVLISASDLLADDYELFPKPLEGGEPVFEKESQKKKRPKALMQRAVAYISATAVADVEWD